MNALKVIESEIDKCINTARTSFLRVAELITKVRDEEIYLEAFKTFEEWCEVGMGWTKRRANQLIAGAETVNDLPPSLAKEVKTEWEARALGKLDREDQKEAIREAKREGVPLTEAIKLFAEKPAAIGQKPGTNVPITKVVEDKPVVDECDFPIPKDLHELWARRNEVESISREVAALKNKFLGLQCTEDPLWKGFEAQRSAEFCSNIHQALSAVRLFAVCVVCQGRGRKSCAFCAGKGLISKFKWDTQATMEAKEIRKRSLAMKGGK